MTMVARTLDYCPKSFEGHKLFSVNPNCWRTFRHAYLQDRSIPKNVPTISANISHTCHVGFPVDFSSTKNIMNRSS